MTSEHVQRLEFYECSFENDHFPSFVTADLNLRASAPQKYRPLLLRISIPLRNPRQNGLPVTEESIRLYELEEKIETVLTRDGAAVLAGMMWQNGIRILYYYCGAQLRVASVLQVLDPEFPPHTYTWKITEDPTWDVFLAELYPNGLGMQYISDRHTVETLQKAGDALTPSRDVRHWAYFPDEKARTAFTTEVGKLGFSRIALSKNEADVRPFVLIFSRTDSVTFQDVQGFTQDLWILADRLGGQYDGWECQVTTGK